MCPSPFLFGVFVCICKSANIHFRRGLGRFPLFLTSLLSWLRSFLSGILPSLPLSYEEVSSRPYFFDLFTYFLSPFLVSFFPSFLPMSFFLFFLPSFLPSYPWFSPWFPFFASYPGFPPTSLGFLPSFLGFLPSFLSSFFPTFFLSFLPSFLSWHPSFLSWHPSFLPSFLPTFLPSFLLLLFSNFFHFISFQAGGKASTGTGNILDVIPQDLHEHVPCLMGSMDDVTEAEKYIKKLR